MKKFDRVKMFMLDMDGTFYLGDTLLPGATDFLAACRAKEIEYTFLTNNSSKSAEDYLQKLVSLGVHATRQEMFTSGDATLLYLAEKGFSKEIHLVGTSSLHRQFEQEGYHTRAAQPVAVVLGYDTGIDFAGLAALCSVVRTGLPYIATHPDRNCPVQGGFVPDVGAVLAYVQASTGRWPDFVVGKPEAYMAQAVAQRAGLPMEALCMVGDRLYTDIALGACGVRTALVLSGETRREEVAHSGIVPDGIYENLAEMAGLLYEV